MYKRLIFIPLAILALRLYAQDVAKYIRDYEDIAVSEMLRTGIPASIKLAQGMLESNCGTSELARKSNNHFGIKCGSDWSGKGVHREDDDYENGKLVKSCFRHFDSAFESYVAHSDFLMDPRKEQRYGALFRLKPTDYKGWAVGLSRAGYATDPRYADKLIKLIEDNELYALDSADASPLAGNAPRKGLGNELVRQNNNVDFITARDGESIVSLSARTGIDQVKLLKYNDYAFAVNQKLTKGTKVYLEMKRTGFHGKRKYHVLKEGQDLLFVAQTYGMRLDALQKRNRIPEHEFPVPGQKIMLKGHPKAPLKTRDPYEIPEPKDVPVQPEPASNTVIATSKPVKPARVDPPGEAQTGKSADSIRINNAAVSLSPSIRESILNQDHVVAKGDTLYSIARNYGISVSDLKSRNNLAEDTIFVGQKLQIK